MSLAPPPASAPARPPSATRARREKSGDFCQDIILGALARMPLGGIAVELPDGSERRYGDAAAPVTAHVRIQSQEFFKRCVLYADVGFGEAYVDGLWETDDIVEVISWFIANYESSPAHSGSRVRNALVNLLFSLNRLQHILRPNDVRTSRRNIEEHYDLGNEFYRLWLDGTMTYSSALYREEGHSLEEAQVAKYEALCQGTRIEPGDHVLEIGSGWGGFACYAAKKYGCRVTTVTISPAQHAYAVARVQREGVADRVEVRLQDYRHVQGRFDKVISIEMMEALGNKYLEAYFRKIHEVLAPDGLVGLQYITVPDDRHEEVHRGVDWIQKYIFPGSLLLSVGRVNRAINRTGNLSLFQLKDLGLSYARTLREWRRTFNARAEEVRALTFDDRFIRKWNYYLSYCEAAFAMRNISVVQAIYTRPNNPRLRSWA